MLQIALVAHHQHGKLIAILHAQYLTLKLWYFIEAGMIVQREHEQETLARTHILLSHGTELLLAGRIEYW